MKVMCVIGGFVYGGAERVMTKLVNYISKDNEVIYVAINHKESSAYEISDNVKVINGIKYKNKIDGIPKLRTIILNEKPDIILSFLTQINIVTIIAALGTSIPVVVSERNDPSRTSHNLKLLRRILYHFASGIVFQTEYAKQYFPKRLQKKSTVISNPVFLEEELINYHCKKRKKEIVAVGRLEPQKNYPLLLNAFKMVNKEYPEYKLLIYGDGSEKRKLVDLKNSLELGMSVEFKGTKKNVHELIKDACLYVMSSDFEGMPNALMEAMALGLCCVSTDCPVGGPRFLIDDGINGRLVRVSDEKMLQDTIIELLENSALADKLSNNARNILKELDPNVVCRRWLDYLVEIAVKIGR